MKVDTNSDGALDLAEWKAAGRRERGFTMIDADKDGKVTPAELRAAGFVPDYAVVRRPDLSEPPDGEPGPRVALVAARLGRTRLIDNLEFDLGGSAG